MALIKNHVQQDIQDLPKFSTFEEAKAFFEANEDIEKRDYVVEEIAKFEEGALYLVSFIDDDEADKKISTKIASVLATLEPTDELIEAIMELLKLDNAYIRNLGISILRDFGAAIKYYIVKFLIGDDRDLRIFAINVLGDVDFAESRDMLVELLESEEDINVAMTAVDYMAEIGEEEDIPLLESLKDRFNKDVYAEFAVDNAIKLIKRITKDVIPLSKDNFAKISEFIYRKSGIFLEDEKHYEKLAKYIDARCNELSFDNFRKYFFKLRFDDKDGEEFQALMNAITVNETYFYREKDQFEVLVNRILPELDSVVPKNRPLRILSSPCSTGEEPYSIILHIVEEGKVVERRDIEVVGIDIDSTVIKKAQVAKYSERSVHAIPKNVLSKWFVKKPLGYELCEDLQGTVDFHVANVFDKTEMRKLGKFDVIFSRNMLIYFDDSSRKEVAMTFYDMLNTGGYVLLGHAEYMSRIVSVFNAKKSTIL